jgi:hypothetical protein
MADQAETAEFLKLCSPAFHRIYETIPNFRQAREQLARRIEDLEQHILKIESNAFVNIPYEPDDPNQPTAYNKLVWRPLKSAELELARLKNSAAAERGRLLARLGVTEESIALLSGAVLQFARQVLSYRFAAKPSDLSGARMIGHAPHAQSIVEIIWEGRNHALHYEEGVPRSAVRQMLTTLEAAFNQTFDPRKNNSSAILAVLGWTGANIVEEDLKVLIALERSSQ